GLFSELVAKPHEGESAEDAQEHIREGDVGLAAADEEEGLVAESREGGKAAEDSRKEEEPKIRADDVLARGDAGKQANDEAAGNVYEERAERETPVRRMMQNPTAQFVADDGADEAAEANEEHLSEALGAHVK